MTIASNVNGTQTCVIGTEHTLATIAAAGTFVAVIDTTNLALGDTLEIRAKAKAKSAGSHVQYFLVTYQHVQADPMKISVPVPSVDSVTFTVKQTAGTGRSFDWNIYQL